MSTRYVLFTKSLWTEAPRLRHQVARMLAGHGHRVAFFEKPAWPWKKASASRDGGVDLLQTHQLVHHQLRVLPPLRMANACYEAAQIRRVLRLGPTDRIINFNYDYYFLRELAPANPIVTIHNDDFIAGANALMKRQAAWMVRTTSCRSDHNLTVSYPLLDQIGGFTRNVSLFLPWARHRYTTPPRGLGRNALLYWGYVNDRIDVGLALALLDAGIPVHFVGPLTPSEQMTRMLAHPMATYQQSTPLEQLGETISRCAAAILPYDVSDPQVGAVSMSNRGFELLSFGLPLLYRRLPGLIAAPPTVIHQCGDGAEFIAAFERARSQFDDAQADIERFLSQHYEENRYAELMAVFDAVAAGRRGAE